MSNAVIYARFSSDKQREESIEGQIRECKAFAAGNNITIIGVYIDRAMSARTDRRPDFLKMIKDSSKKTFDYVIVYQLDRFSRSRYDSAIYKNKLKKNGVKVLSAKENIKDDPSGIILESVLEGYAEYYSAELSQKVKRGMTDNLLEKKWNGSRVPFGYRKKENGTLEVDGANGEMLKQIFDMFIHGRTIAYIIRYLNDHNYRTSAHGPFTRNSLQHLLRNRIYTGTFIWGDTEYPDFAPRLITDDVYNASVYIFTSHKRSTVARQHSDAYALTGKIYCGHCGLPITGHSGKSKAGVLHYYYRCATKNNGREREKRDGVKCPQKNIRRDALEDLVLNTTIEILSTPESLRCIAEQAVKAQEHADQSAEIKRLELAVKNVEKRLQNSIHAVEQGIISDTITKNIKTYETELKSLKQQLSIEKLARPDFQITADAVEYFLQQLLVKKNKNDEYKLDMFQAFIRRIIVTDKQVAIEYNYHAVPNILKNPVNKMLTRCSSNNALVTR